MYKPAIVVFVIVFLFYSSVGYTFVDTTDILDKYDMILNTDVKRVRDDIVFFREDYPLSVDDYTPFSDSKRLHYRTDVHPLFVLFVNPLGATLSILIPFPIVTILFNAAAATLCAIFFFMLLKRLKLSDRLSTLMSFSLSMTMAHIFFGIIPETYAFSAASIMAILLFSKKSWHRIMTAVIATGITVTNFVAPIIFYVLSLKKDYLRKTAAFASMIIAALLVLTMLQYAIYSTTTPIFAPKAFYEEPFFVHPETLEEPSNLVLKTLSYLYVYPSLAPDLSVGTAINFSNFSFSIVRAIGLSCLAYLLIMAGFVVYKKKLYQNDIIKWSLAWLLFLTGFHMFYGQRTLFLYSMHTTFPLYLIFAQTVRRYRFLIAIIVLLTVCMMINNIDIIFRMIDIAQKNGGLGYL